jgi:hypothetical protein
MKEKLLKYLGVHLWVDNNFLKSIITLRKEKGLMLAFTKLVLAIK